MNHPFAWSPGPEEFHGPGTPEHQFNVVKRAWERALIGDQEFLMRAGLLDRKDEARKLIGADLAAYR